MLKLFAFVLLALAMTTFTGVAHFSYVQPATESLLSFVFLSIETALSHGITGIVIALIVFYFIKKSIQLLLSATFLFVGIAGILWFFY